MLCPRLGLLIQQRSELSQEVIRGDREGEEAVGFNRAAMQAAFVVAAGHEDFEAGVSLAAGMHQQLGAEWVPGEVGEQDVGWALGAQQRREALCTIGESFDVPPGLFEKYAVHLE